LLASASAFVFVHRFVDEIEVTACLQDTKLHVIGNSNLLTFICVAITDNWPGVLDSERPPTDIN
jgi:hypothetical protein